MEAREGFRAAALHDGPHCTTQPGNPSPRGSVTRFAVQIHSRGWLCYTSSVGIGRPCHTSWGGTLTCFVVELQAKKR
jgi:hypothetical protein